MASGDCPYCGGRKFVSASAVIRGRGKRDPDKPDRMIDRTFVNQCARCRQYALWIESTGELVELIDPADGASRRKAT